MEERMLPDASGCRDIPSALLPMAMAMPSAPAVATRPTTIAAAIAFAPVGGSGRFFGWLRSVGRTCGHGQHRTDEHHGKQQRYDSFRRNFHDKLPPIFKRFGVSVWAAL